MKRTPIKRHRSTPRRTTSPRCTTQRCNKPARIAGMCVTHAERKADTMFSKWVRLRDGGCTAAGVLRGTCEGPLQAAHVEGRGEHRVRYDTRNVHALCARHHMLVDQRARNAAKAKWARHILGDDAYLRLMEDALQRGNRVQAIEDALHWLGGDGW